ncbi:hypothetical protein ACQ86N_37015 [Puia sp. P3]|uniref:hypothetical protein n=1 Tax=Puia sp. P3 TaxID=3423952 RepID=UPI003D66AA94
MSKFGLVVVLMLMAGVGRAQGYFVFIEADNNQPFYVRVGEQVYPSSAAGHLILAQLKDSTYIITIGLPGQSALERRYAVAIRRRDLEFRLKDLGDRGWGLYDEQAREMKTPEAGGGKWRLRRLALRKTMLFPVLWLGWCRTRRCYIILMQCRSRIVSGRILRFCLRGKLVPE